MSEWLKIQFSKIRYSIVMRHFMRRILSSWMHWEKYMELTFDSKGDLYCVKDNVSYLNADADASVNVDADAEMLMPSFPNGPWICELSDYHSTWKHTKAFPTKIFYGEAVLKNSMPNKILFLVKKLFL